MPSLFRIILFVILCSFTFSSSAAAMLCNISDADKTETQETHNNTTGNHDKNCHDDETQQNTDKPLDDCCHDMNLCHASLSILSGNEALTQIYINHFSIQKWENDHLIINSSSPPDRPPKYLA